jgi:hypothetical protein
VQKGFRVTIPSPTGEDEPALTKEERFRRIVLVCTHFMRNLAYYRGARESPTGWTNPPLSPDASFWRTMANNCLDFCILEFCKLFADQHGKHLWRKVVSQDKLTQFEADLFRYVGLSAAEWDAYLDEMRRYRDKFIAHLDDDRIMRPPHLDHAKLAVEFYHHHIVDEEALPGTLGGLVDVATVATGFAQEKAMAARIFGKVSGSR